MPKHLLTETSAKLAAFRWAPGLLSALLKPPVFLYSRAQGWEAFCGCAVSAVSVLVSTGSIPVPASCCTCCCIFTAIFTILINITWHIVLDCDETLTHHGIFLLLKGNE